jgi:hypothetical protein
MGASISFADGLSILPNSLAASVLSIESAYTTVVVRTRLPSPRIRRVVDLMVFPGMLVYWAISAGPAVS